MHVLPEWGDGSGDCDSDFLLCLFCLFEVERSSSDADYNSEDVHINDSITYGFISCNWPLNIILCICQKRLLKCSLGGYQQHHRKLLTKLTKSSGHKATYRKNTGHNFRICRTNYL